MLATHLTLKQPIENEREFVEQLLDACREDKQVNILPSLIKIRKTLPISRAGKIDMTALAAETEGYLEI